MQAKITKWETCSGMCLINIAFIICFLNGIKANQVFQLQVIYKYFPWYASASLQTKPQFAFEGTLAWSIFT